MKTRTIWRYIPAAVIVALLALAQSSPASTLSAVFVNTGNASEAEVRALARRQFEHPETDAPKFPSDKAEDRVTFTGWFVPASNETSLAVFSDDGVDIFIDGKRYLPWRLGRGQHLPNMSQSFRLVKDIDPNNWRNEIFVANRVYHIRIEYKNTQYMQGTAGNNYFIDIDGCTLFAFNGGGRIFDLEMVTPAGDPVDHPVDQGDGQNEFTFSPLNPGTFSINFKARVMPNTQENIDFFDDKVTFTVDNVGNSVRQWDAANPNGKATRTGNVFTATATFTGLPANNSDFGTKKASVQRQGVKGDEATFEVFWPLLLDPAGPRNDANFAKNHPGPDLNATRADFANTVAGDAPRAPNWFYYWGQGIPEFTAQCRYGGGLAAVFGRTPGIRHFQNGYAGRADRIIIFELVSSFVDAARGNVSGIDKMRNTVTHELVHRDQVVNFTNEAFHLGVNGGTNVSDAFWSFNIARPAAVPAPPLPAGRVYNHFRDFIGGANGNFLDRLDRNGDGDFDDIDEDEDLDRDIVALVGRRGNHIPNWREAGQVETAPSTPGIDVEDDAERLEVRRENERARFDWGNPGKNHKTINKYDD